MTICQPEVKEERPDEAEIKALAARIVESNRKKVTTTGSTGVIQNNCRNRGSILCYFPKLNSTMPSTDTRPQNDKSTPDDGPSVSGRFCWTIIGKTTVPCLLKNDSTKYVSVRIAESKVLHHFLTRLNTEVFNCVSVKSFSITEAETRLLNEINCKYCEGAFSKEAFSMDSDFIVKLDDLIEFYSFMETCYNKLTHVPSNGANKCGFVRINDDSVVPYAVKNGQQYVPLFYFEGETESLKTKAINLENWDLAYLKFCCKVQGIKNELFASEQCQVTSLEDVKSYFPEGTKFDEYWPTKLLDMQTPTRNDVNGNLSWVQTPHVETANVPQATVPNASHTMAKTMSSLQKQLHNNQRVNTTAVINASTPNASLYQGNSWQSTLMGANTNSVPSNTYPLHQAPGQPRLPQKQNSNVHPAVAAMNSNPIATSRSYVGQQVRPHGNQYYSTAVNNVPTVTSGAVQQPPPLVRVTTTNSVPNTFTATSAQNENFGLYNSTSLPSLYTMSIGNNMHTMNTASATQLNKIRSNVPNQTVQNAQNPRYPPALTPIAANNGVPTNATNVITNTRNHRNPSYVQNGGGEIIDLSSPPHSPQSTTNNMPTRRNPVMNNFGDFNKNSNFGLLKPLVQVSDVTPSMMRPHNPPFKAQTIHFRSKAILAMNLKPYNFDEYVLTLPDVISNYFPRVDLQRMRYAMQNALGITLYKGNTLHMQLLKDNIKCRGADEEIPLIRLKDLDQFYRQLEYVEQTARPPDDIEREAKRQKIS